MARNRREIGVTSPKSSQQVISVSLSPLAFPVPLAFPILIAMSWGVYVIHFLLFLSHNGPRRDLRGAFCRVSVYADVSSSFHDFRLDEAVHVVK
jgi:hypothetical protein